VHSDGDDEFRIGFEEFILTFVVLAVCYVHLAKASLSYYGIKNSVTENDISEFYEGMNAVIRPIFQRGGLFGKPVVFPKSANDSQQSVSLKIFQQRRYELSIIPLILIITTIYDLFWRTRFIDIIEYVFLITCWCFLFYKCFFFGRRFETIVKRRAK
jgi:hypothetical protein